MDVHAYFPNDIYTLKGWTPENLPWSCIIAGSGSEIRIPSWYRVMVPTGIILDIPVGYSVRVHNRSSMAVKHGIKLANHEGVIDYDYHDPFFVVLENTTDTPFLIKHGDRIAQMEMVPKWEYQVVETTEKPQPKADRIGGFGSTGR